MAYLFVLNGTSRFRALHLPQEGVISIGKRDDADLCLKDPWISWNHAELRMSGGAFELKDLGSTNGTFVNFDRVEGEGAHPLVDEDVLFLGGTHLLIVTANRLPSAPPRPLPVPPTSARQTTARLDRLPDPFDLRPIPVAEDDDDGEIVGEATMRMAPAMIDSLEGELASLDDDGGVFAPSLAKVADTRTRLERALLLPRPVDLPESALSESGLLRGSVQIDLRDLLGNRGLEESGLDWQSTSSVSGPGSGFTPGLGASSGLRHLAPLPRTPATPLPPESAPAAPPAFDDHDDPLLDAFDPVELGSGVRPSPETLAQKDREIAALKARLAEQDHEVGRLRHDLLRIKEQYLDLDF